MNKTFANKNLFIYIVAAVALLATSCEKEPLWQRWTSKPTIIPVVQSVVTKAGSEEMPEDGMPGRLISERVVASADGFDLIEEVYENRLNPFVGESATKGTIVTNDNIGSFGMDAYAEDKWFDNTIAAGDLGSKDNPNAAGAYFSQTVSNSSGSWTISGDPKWLNNVPITFWSWKYVKPTRTDTHTATFNYTVNSTVTSQEDPVFAFNNETREFDDQGDIKNGANENINIYFYHALSAVQFLEHEDIISDYRISNIEVQNVKNSTVCTMTSTDAAPSSGNISFSHNTSASSTVNFSQSYDANDTSLDIPTTTSKFKPDDSKTFIMIPQTLGASSKLKVTFTYTGTPSATTSPVFDLNGTVWDDGYYYVYKVDLGGAIKVKLYEDCDSSTKSNVKFQNDSNMNEYIRAAVVGNWFDASGNIVAPWSGSVTTGTGWSLESDGFYYYTSPVTTKDYTENFITSFTKPTSAPVAGAHFELTVLVQAVCSDGYSSYTSAF